MRRRRYSMFRMKPKKLGLKNFGMKEHAYMELIKFLKIRRI